VDKPWRSTRTWPTEIKIDGVEEDEGNRVVETGGRMPRIEVDGNICSRRPRPNRAVEPMMMMILK